MYRCDSIDGPTTWHTTEADAIAEKLRRVAAIRALRSVSRRDQPVVGVVVWFDAQGAVA